MQNPDYIGGSLTKRTDRESLVFLLKGRERGKPAWVYVRVQKNKLELFKHDIKQNYVDISRYGEKLFSGWGVEPPANIMNKINMQYK